MKLPAELLTRILLGGALLAGVAGCKPDPAPEAKPEMPVQAITPKPAATPAVTVTPGETLPAATVVPETAPPAEPACTPAEPLDYCPGCGRG
jgi:hypothetical protein